MFNIYIFITVVGVLLFILGGISASANIKDTVPYLLFWFMYIISLATLANIFITIYYYFVMKDKTGPRGIRGPRGDKGDTGKDGKCNVGCRNNICVNSMMTAIANAINNAEIESGNPNSNFTVQDIHNLYIKEKIKSMCQSTEFQQLIPYKGAKNLIAYMSNIWADIAKRIYDAGGIAYFKTIGAENDWDWVEENPWNEFKKYDIYYWGLTKDYRPQIKDKCDKSDLGTAFDGSKFPEHRHLAKSTNTKNYKSPSKKDSKYSVLTYINTPSTVSTKASYDGINNYTDAFNTKNKAQIKLYNAFTYKPSAEIQQKYEAGKNVNKPRRLKPMSYLISHKKNDNSCANVNNYGSVYYTTCDPYNPKQVFTLNFDNNTSSKMKTFKLYNEHSGKSIANGTNGALISKVKGSGDTYKLR